MLTSDDHLLNFTSSCTPAYHTLPEKTYRALEVRLNKAAEFFGAVIVPSILDDAKQFFVGFFPFTLGILLVARTWTELTGS